MSRYSPEGGRARTIKKVAAGAVGVAAVATGVAVAAGQPPQPPTFPSVRSEYEKIEANPFCKLGLVELKRIMGSDEQKMLENKTWDSIGNVFNQGLISRESLSLEPISVSCNPFSLTTTSADIRGSFKGITPDGKSSLGFHFATKFQGAEKASAQGFQANFTQRVVRDSSSGIGSTDSVGIEFPRTVEAEIDYYGGKPDFGMESKEKIETRMIYLQGLLKKVLNMPENTPFIPDKNLTSFMTVINENKTGYSLFVATDGPIDGYSVHFRVFQGLAGDKDSWKDIAGRYGLDPAKVSYESLLRKVVDDLRTENTIREIMRRPEAPGTSAILALYSGMQPGGIGNPALQKDITFNPGGESSVQQLVDRQEEENARRDKMLKAVQKEQRLDRTSSIARPKV